MSYVDPDFKSKKDLKGAVIRARALQHATADLTEDISEQRDLIIAIRSVLRKGGPVGPFATYNPSGMFPVRENGQDTIEGPHYPKPHRWYARVQVEHGVIVKVIS